MSGVHILTGDDPVLLADALSTLLDGLLGDQSADGVVEEYGPEDTALVDAVAAASTESMFGERIVILRQAGRYGADAVTPLLDYAADPLESSTLLVVWERPETPGATKKPLPKKLSDAVQASGGSVIATAAPKAANAQHGWIRERVAGSSIQLTPAAERMLGEHLGENLSGLLGVLSVLEASFDAGTLLDHDAIGPYLPEAGGVPPWDLTDAINGGDVTAAVNVVRRMMHGGGRHPLQLMATLQSHVEHLVRLDGSGARGESAAAALLGIKPYPAKKLLGAQRAMGSAGTRRAVQLLAQADADLRGMTALPAEATMEILVARLAALCRS